MQNRDKLKPLLLALGLMFGATTMVVGTARAQAVVGNEATEASIELGNTSEADQSADAVAVDPTAENTDPAAAKPPKDPREAYRDQILKESAETPGANAALSRRYKKVDKGTYNELLKNAEPQPPQ